MELESLGFEFGEFGFRKRYRRGSFWSGYEHHASTGLTNLEESSRDLRSTAS